MRRLPAFFLAPLVLIAVGACSASAAPGWTYAPAPSASATPSGGASTEPSGAASAPASVAPSVAPSGAPSIAPSGSADGSPTASGGTTLTVTAPVGAASSGFQPTTLDAPANTAFTIHFDNQDNTAPHNVQLKGPAGDVTLGGDTQFFTGPGTRDYAVPALPAGTYTYYCIVHATMMGTLTVK